MLLSGSLELGGQAIRMPLFRPEELTLKGAPSRVEKRE